MAKKKKAKKKTSSISSLQNQINSLKSQNASYKNTIDSYSAKLSEAYSYDEAQKAINDYNTESAATQMQFQEYMSSTAHTREVQDLIAAGLNPILSTNQGAAAGMGAYAVSDNSATSAKFADHQLSKQLANNAAMNQANIIAQKAMNKYNTDRQYKLGLQQARISASATKAAAGAAAAAQMYAANQAAAAARYGSKLNYDAQIKGQQNQQTITRMNNIAQYNRQYENNQETAKRQQYQLAWQTQYPNTIGGIFGSVTRQTDQYGNDPFGVTTKAGNYNFGW